MSDTDLTSVNPVLTPHNLQILQWMIQPASEGLLILSSPAPAGAKAPEGISGESHV
ncbi:TPA: hypothetical protein G8N74_003917 [Salmonella enterica]|uniref:Uncharacterized protein n=1 Tax=Salmonella enterica TaxID=28901 RepID=A0A743UL53_SALER|nr:hypothetical protein [Salmonella enterica]EDN4217899.1 hypothetical protein [Salmonella enterica subsp. enterica]EDN4903994.1 hypothetical protein [Salmonella enterica subsp. enterica serovar Saintpaul]EDR1499675.1 hypothetical protein [Salmonella enterica subsp. enterica serovar Javiana]EDS7486259.1 hypothetical protein [Salmonella enterica subsp. enterica serovar Berta]EDT1415329.1 hypothetical protein [Salmonella enterica subsp. enterica serovar Braenderup]EDX3570473.1 hypothetical prot